ncbi:MAG: hypothetical protein K9K66_19365 [Desulfarculaceae bacterium]|nr:hypothetical protein [Desulfarculaceae bacterium]MCF8074382.1 hypothetical protein [Desulfarculaceae bacterium]MCF8103815.1 hypothetical protein [Desulfarculaceae bacterium]MCF8118154.1 hypothetical protein [Desulfarculaceae bacterium]
MSFVSKMSNGFAAGALGGLANALAVWLAGAAGITLALGVKIAPPLNKAMIYQRMVWGGVWGLAFLLPILRGSVFWRGLVISLGPTLVTLLVVFPYQAGKGMWGLDLGVLTPAFVVLFNAIWGWVAAAWLKAAGR